MMARRIGGFMCILMLCAAAGFAGQMPGLEEVSAPASALSAAIGPVSAGIVGDASAVQDNPARLREAGGAGIAVTHTIWPVDVSDSNLQASIWAPGIGGIGLMARMMECSFTEEIENLDGTYCESGGSFSYRTVKAGIAASPDLSSMDGLLPGRISAGASICILQRELADSTERGAGASAGLNISLPKGFSGYAAVKDVGRIGKDPLPASAHIGAAYSRRGALLEADSVMLGVELNSTKGAGAGGAVGGEYALRSYPVGIGLRAGYRVDEDSRAGSLPTAGLVLRWDEFAMEYGLMEMGDLGVGQALSLSFRKKDSAGQDPAESY